jgi:Lipocalin-like domain
VQDESARQFAGTWRLVSFTNQLADGTLKPDPRNTGYIVYTDTGRMCAMIVDPNRPKWASAAAPTPTEAVAAIEAMFSYCGTYEVSARDGFVVHRVEVDKDRGRGSVLFEA